MKKNLYLLSIGMLVCSCSEPGDVVTGHARVLFKNAPAPVVSSPGPGARLTIAPKPVAPAPEVVAPKPVAEKPAPAPEPARVVAQKQPVTTEPTPAPELKPAPAPAPEAEKKTEAPSLPALRQNQPATTPARIAPSQPEVPTPAEITPAPVQVSTPAVAEAKPAPAPEVSKPRVARPRISQKQPRTTSPSRANNYTPQATQPAKRRYPTMPGQNRGLRTSRRPQN